MRSRTCSFITPVKGETRHTVESYERHVSCFFFTAPDRLIVSSCGVYNDESPLRSDARSSTMESTFGKIMLGSVAALMLFFGASPIRIGQEIKTEEQHSLIGGYYGYSCTVALSTCPACVANICAVSASEFTCDKSGGSNGCNSGDMLSGCLKSFDGAGCNPFFGGIACGGFQIPAGCSVTGTKTVTIGGELFTWVTSCGPKTLWKPNGCNPTTDSGNVCRHCN